MARHTIYGPQISYCQSIFQMLVPIDLFADMAAILICIVPKDIMGCSGGKLRCIFLPGIP